MKPPYQNASFLKSITDIRQAPFSLAEVAFAGRSNCGKSSLINTLTNQKKIARVSKTPGRTREINFFSLGNDKFLVDLPGYGYAKVSKQMQKNWSLLLENYLVQREALKTLFILIDSRVILTDFDHMLIDFCVKKEINFVILATKVDQVNQSQKSKIKPMIQSFLMDNYKVEMKQIWLTSSFKKSGFSQLIQRLDEIFEFNDFSHTKNIV